MTPAEAHSPLKINFSKDRQLEKRMTTMHCKPIFELYKASKEPESALDDALLMDQLGELDEDTNLAS